jgi:hypothetical protein
VIPAVRAFDIYGMVSCGRYGEDAYAVAAALTNRLAYEHDPETELAMKILTKLLVAAVAYGFAASTILQAGAPGHGAQPTVEPDWSELIASMDKMHMAMGAIDRSGNSDVDFVRLMLPHHQAAIDMAKTQLLYGKDAQMRRLAQEIITDQQLEIELMQHWLKQREPGQAKENQTPAAKAGKEN